MMIVIFFTMFARYSGCIQNSTEHITETKPAKGVSVVNRKESCCSFPTDFASQAKYDADK